MIKRNATDIHSFLKIVSVDVGTTSQDKVAAYRGHRDIHWDLLPKIARPPFKGPEAFCLTQEPNQSAESSLYKLFRDYATSLMPASIALDNDQITSWRTLIVAQHYGTPTRLLDWSTNPLVALFLQLKVHLKKAMIQQFSSLLNVKPLQFMAYRTVRKMGMHLIMHIAKKVLAYFVRHI